MDGPAGQPLRTWIADAALVGTGVGALFPPTLVVVVSALDPSGAGPKAVELAKLELASTVSALATALLAAVPAALLVRWCWPRTPGGTLCLGPGIGAAAGVALFTGISMLLQPTRAIETRLLVWVALAGAAGVGPPWIAYLAVLARGRSARPVAWATPAWATAAIATALGLAWLRWKLGYAR